jgi:hypothetical protein
MFMSRGWYLILLASWGIISCGCASWAGAKERYIVCSYDQVWQAALDSLKDRAVVVKDKDKGFIRTDWLETPAPGRTFGALRREMADSQDRSRVSVDVKRLNDVTRVSFAEERERYAFRGGSRMFGWAPTEPSEAVMADVQRRLDVKLKEHGCPAT